MSSFLPLTDYLLASALAHNSVNSNGGGHQFDFDVDGKHADAHFFLEYNPTQVAVNRIPGYTMAFIVAVRVDQQNEKGSSKTITIDGTPYTMDERTILDLTETIYQEIIEMWKQHDNGLTLDNYNAISLAGYADSIYAGWRIDFSLTLHRGQFDRCDTPNQFGVLPGSGL